MFIILVENVIIFLFFFYVHSENNPPVRNYDYGKREEVPLPGAPVENLRSQLPEKVPNAVPNRFDVKKSIISSKVYTFNENGDRIDGDDADDDDGCPLLFMKKSTKLFIFLIL